MAALVDLCKVVRTKNAGPFLITIDIVFKDARTFQEVKRRELLSPERVAEAYGLTSDELVGFLADDNMNCFKVTFRRRIPSGHPGDSDCYGMNQEAPLLQLQIPIIDAESPS